MAIVWERLSVKDESHGVTLSRFVFNGVLLQQRQRTYIFLSVSERVVGLLRLDSLNRKHNERISILECVRTPWLDVPVPPYWNVYTFEDRSGRIPETTHDTFEEAYSVALDWVTE